MGGFGSTRWSWTSTRDTSRERALARHQSPQQGRLPSSGLFGPRHNGSFSAVVYVATRVNGRTPSMLEAGVQGLVASPLVSSARSR